MNKELNFNIDELKGLNSNKIIKIIDFEFKLTIKTILDQTLIKYKGIPISWEDLYYEFLYEVPELVRVYDHTTNVPFKTFLGIKARYFSSNKCKSFITNKHKVLNQYVTIDEKISEARLNDSKPLEIPIDTSSLSKDELDIYYKYFLDGENVTNIAKNKKISKYKINKIIQSIKFKLLSQVKN